MYYTYVFILSSLCCYLLLASKKLQAIKDEVARIQIQSIKLNEQITSTQRMIVYLQKSGNKDDQLCCKELNANVLDLSKKAKQLRNEHQKVLPLLMVIKWSMS